MDQIKIGRFLAALRHEAGLTQAALGERLGVTGKTVSRWECANYMPDIEMFAQLSALYGVSINELLAGERLTDDRLRTAADQNLLDVARETSFTLAERTAFWRRKWLRDHAALIALCAAFAAGLWMGLLCSPWRAWAGFCPIVWLAVYGVLRNRMMIYIEEKLWGGKPRKEETS
ncbi:MAG: helix-turn-helix transcriptional regulator [Clostridia bacterium]|nr:helix-turn-helix transcriptional regulator [Clostridia bacterium]